jgi:hypothetical protein
MMIMNDTYVRILKEVGATYFEVLSHHSP